MPAKLFIHENLHKKEFERNVEIVYCMYSTAWKQERQILNKKKSDETARK